MPEHLDFVAAKMAEVYHKHKDKKKVKWGHLDPADRSLWRLIATVAENEFSKPFRD